MQDSGVSYYNKVCSAKELLPPTKILCISCQTLFSVPLAKLQKP